ncbi:MAG: hypothetical protein GC168_10970 [Candidatus Hydrogenedens sp.]|nr:hypothetical protein [Candidatus Hydrogenedens sp.]
MVSKFRSTTQAIAYLSQIFQPLAADAPLHLSALAGGGFVLAERTIPKHDLHATLDRECGKFPQATVVIGESSASRTYGAIQCSCDSETRKSCPHHCQHSYARPLMLVLASPEDVAERGHIVDHIAKEVHADLKAERHRCDLDENENLAHHTEKRREHAEKSFKQWLGKDH